jgi:4,4'-diaponeurosporenoate glycosyltransferase
VIEHVIAAAGFLAWRARLPSRTPPPPPPARFPRVSIIVPARDEEANLPPLLASLARLDPGPAEIIVVDDHSTDATAALARAAGVRVVSAPPLPEGWSGKPWACLHGAAAATGELLLFTDADTVHAPASLGLAVARLEAEGAGVLSLVPSQAIVSPWERFQGVFHLLALAASGRAYAIGQYLLFRRDAYDAIGGHAAAPARVAEDLALARRVPRRTLLAVPGLVEARMYPDLASFARGWVRNFREGIPEASVTGVLATVAIVGWLLGLPLHAALAAARGEPAAALILGAATAATVVEVAGQQRRCGRFGPLSALAYPLFVLIFVGISIAAAAASLARRPVIWRGRVVPRPGTRPGRPRAVSAAVELASGGAMLGDVAAPPGAGHDEAARARSGARPPPRG